MCIRDRHIVKAIKSVYDDQPYFSDDIKEGLFNLAIGHRVVDGSKPEPKATSSLTDRELEVLKLITQEMSTQEMANQLLLSVNTVETYRKSLLKKLNVKNAVGLAMYAVKHKII